MHPAITGQVNLKFHNIGNKIKNTLNRNKGFIKMNNNFNMSFDPVIRQQFAELTANYGLTVPQAFKLFANQAVKTGVLPLSFDWQRKNSETEDYESLNR